MALPLFLLFLCDGAGIGFGLLVRGQQHGAGVKQWRGAGAGLTQDTGCQQRPVGAQQAGCKRSLHDVQIMMLRCE
jgi:hypothetical protein